MHIAILTFEGFNELDSLIALGILNRIKQPGWRVSIASPTARVRSMNGVVLESQASLAEACAADAVIVGSGIRTREVVADPALMAQLRLDPARQLLGAQCSGTLVLAKLATRPRSGVYGSNDQALGAGGRHRCAEPGVLCQGQCGDRRWLPGLAIPGGLGHRAAGGCGCGMERDRLRGACGRERRLCGACQTQHRAVSGDDSGRCVRRVDLQPESHPGKRPSTAHQSPEPAARAAQSRLLRRCG